jgi:hypothetical protein
MRSGGKSYPVEYLLFQFCREFHCLPQDVHEMEDPWYDLFCSFMREQQDSDMLEEHRRKQASPR